MRDTLAGCCAAALTVPMRWRSGARLSAPASACLPPGHVASAAYLLEGFLRGNASRPPALVAVDDVLAFALFVQWAHHTHQETAPTVVYDAFRFEVIKLLKAYLKKNTPPYATMLKTTAASSPESGPAKE